MEILALRRELRPCDPLQFSSVLGRKRKQFGTPFAISPKSIHGKSV